MYNPFSYNFVAYYDALHQIRESEDQEETLPTEEIEQYNDYEYTNIFDCLPEEILIKIFGFLHPTE